MARTIEIDFNGKHYKLEFCRRSIVQMEANGLIDAMSVKKDGLGRKVVEEKDGVSYVKDEEGKLVEAVGECSTSAEKKPLETMTELLKSAFYKNHPNITDEEINDLIDNIDDYADFIKALVEILEEAVKVIEKGENKGNLSWGKK